MLDPIEIDLTWSARSRLLRSILGRDVTQRQRTRVRILLMAGEPGPVRSDRTIASALGVTPYLVRDADWMRSSAMGQAPDRPVQPRRPIDTDLCAVTDAEIAEWDADYAEQEAST